MELSRNTSRFENSSSQHDTSQVIQRLKFAYSLHNDAEAASFLGVSPSTIATWKSRNTFPFEILVAKCKHIDWNWLIFGTPAKDTPPFAILDNAADTTGASNTSPSWNMETPESAIHFPDSVQQMIESFAIRIGNIRWESIPADIQNQLAWIYERSRINHEEAFAACRNAVSDAKKTYEQTVKKIQTDFFRSFLRLMEDNALPFKPGED